MPLLKYSVRNMLRNPFRTTLTVLGVAITLVAFMLLRTVISAWNVAADYSAKDRIATRHKISLLVSMPKHYVDKVRGIPGVRQTTFLNWFGAKESRHPTLFFANFMVDPSTFFQVYDELVVPPEQMSRFLAQRNSAILGRSLAKQLGLKVGDRFTLQGTMYAGDWPLEVAGIYDASRRSFDQSSMMLRWDYVNDTLAADERDQIGLMVSRVADAGRGADVGSAIDAMFDSHDQQTLTMSERQLNLSFLGQVTAILRAVDVVSVIVLLILAMILGNTIAMGVRERVREYGVLRALGFLPKHIHLFVLGECVALGLVASGLGIALAVALVNGLMSRMIEENMTGVFPYFRLDYRTVILTPVLAVLLAVLASILPALRATRLTAANAIRRVG
jgi:putative ABC transport system permease protein